MAEAAAAPAETIAFQGVPGAYSHLACREAFPELTHLACETFEDAFVAVQDGRAGRAMIPIENSLAGRVADIHHLLPDSGLYIVAEHFQRVNHQLLAPKGATLDGLEVVHSHVQALAQCRQLVRVLGLKTQVHADTAGAAQEVAARGDPAQGAIASTLAAEIYDLETLRGDIEDARSNFTRFVVMAREMQRPPVADGACVTTFVFRVKSVPAALYKSLGGFATNGVNVIKLESYLMGGSFDVAQFYADIDGHPDAPPVRRALDELEFFSTEVRVLGIYPAHPFRQSH
jgi:prephenate dehydratase